MNLKEEFQEIPTTDLQVILIESELEEDYEACTLIRDELERRKEEGGKKPKEKYLTHLLERPFKYLFFDDYIKFKTGLEITFQSNHAIPPYFCFSQIPANDVSVYPLNIHNEADVIKSHILKELDKNNLIILKSNIDSFIKKNVRTYKRCGVFEVMLKGCIKNQEEDIFLFSYNFTRYSGINTKKELIIEIPK